MLLLAHCERKKDDIPDILKGDLRFVLERTPPLLEEIVKVACYPRHIKGWLVRIAAFNMFWIPHVEHPVIASVFDVD